MDAKATASSSRFMPRSQEDKIQFQLEAFMFQGGDSPSVRTMSEINWISLPVYFVFCDPLPVVSLADLHNVYSEGYSCFCTQ